MKLAEILAKFTKSGLFDFSETEVIFREDLSIKNISNKNCDFNIQKKLLKVGLLIDELDLAICLVNFFKNKMFISKKAEELFEVSKNELDLNTWKQMVRPNEVKKLKKRG